MVYEPIYDPEDYPGVGPEKTVKNDIKFENIFVSGDIFLIDSAYSGQKNPPSIKKLKKISKLSSSLAFKLYDNYRKTI